MALFALGINHRTAPVDMRERLAFAPEAIAEAMQQAREALGLAEVAIISTCNRAEIYGYAADVKQADMIDWLGAYHKLPTNQLLDFSYLHTEDAAIRHLMRVACGLDSMVLGEPQILGQLKSAYAVAQEADTLGRHLERLFQHTFAVAKQVRTETAIGKNPVSVAYAAVRLAQRIFADMSETKALLIGAGKTIDLVARHLQQAGVQDMVIANRTLQRARDIAESFSAHAVLLADIPDELAKADIVVASTASQLPILGKGAVESALKQRKRRPIYMVDIAVPRDIEPEVGELADVYLYSVDDLEQVIQENIRSRQNAALQAEDIVNQGVEQLEQQLRALSAGDLVRLYRDQASTIRSEELDKALKQLNNGASAEQVLESLANGLTNKLIHNPSVQLRKATSEGDAQQVDWAMNFFALKDDEPDANLDD